MTLKFSTPQRRESWPIGTDVKSNLKILVVDNEPLVVEELVEFLTGQGFSCIDAVGSHDALIQFTAHPDVVLVVSDFRMPEMNGVQLLEALKSIAGNDRIFETIIFTGDADTADVINALRAGVSDYFQKPLDLKLLVDGIARVLTKIERRMAESQVRTLSHNLTLLSKSLSDIFDGEGEPPSPEMIKTLPRVSADVPESDPVMALLPSAKEKLSPRQREVAMLINKGLTNYQIACDLGISENTVKIYVSQILRIYNLRNRTQLALMLEGSNRR